MVVDGATSVPARARASAPTPDKARSLASRRPVMGYAYVHPGDGLMQRLCLVLG